MGLIIVHHLILIKYDFLILGEGDTFDINRSIGTSEKKINIIFSKAKAKFCLSLHYNSDNNYLKLIRKMLTFHLNFSISVKGNVYDFSVDYNPIDKSVILNIQKYLMTKNNIK